MASLQIEAYESRDEGGRPHIVGSILLLEVGEQGSGLMPIEMVPVLQTVRAGAQVVDFLRRFPVNIRR